MSYDQFKRNIVELLTLLIFIEKELKRSFIVNGLLQYFGNTSCHYQAKIICFFSLDILA